MYYFILMYYYMMYTSTVTQKGQITLPKVVRDRLGVKSKDVVILRVNKNQVMIESSEDVIDMAGSVKPIRGVDVLSTREGLESDFERS